jgi:polyisoprenoid-binding protein YceI
MKRTIRLCAVTLVQSFAALNTMVAAAPVDYEIDPSHTYPSFEADHLGISTWRGKFNKSSGKVTMDRERGEGSVEVTIDLDSVDFGHDAMNSWARGMNLFDTERFPPAVFKGKLAGFSNGVPKEAVGTLSLHGVTRPLTLKINSLKCVPHPLHKRELCGADAIASFNRDDYGLDAGKSFKFNMEVTLRIQVEAVAVK